MAPTGTKCSVHLKGIVTTTTTTITISNFHYVLSMC